MHKYTYTHEPIQYHLAIQRDGLRSLQSIIDDLQNIGFFVEPVPHTHIHRAHDKVELANEQLVQVAVV